MSSRAGTAPTTSSSSAKRARWPILSRIVAIPHQEISMLSLHLLQLALVYVNTLMIQQILAEPAWSGRLNSHDLRGICRSLPVPQINYRRSAALHFAILEKALDGPIAQFFAQNAATIRQRPQEATFFALCCYLRGRQFPASPKSVSRSFGPGRPYLANPR
jgi:Tn3 transposase DDE domain